MSNITIYHNPRCSKSRQTLELLKENGTQPEVIDYMKAPLSLKQLTELSKYFDFADFVRTNEKEFKALGLALEKQKEVLKAMTEHPKLMQRPIVVKGKKAVIGRPPETVLELI